MTAFVSRRAGIGFVIAAMQVSFVWLSQWQGKRILSLAVPDLNERITRSETIVDNI